MVTPDTARYKKATALYRLVRKEYEFDPDPCSDASPKERVLKWVLTFRLTLPERILLIMYNELGTVRELAAVLGVARSTLGDELKRIKDKVRTEVAHARQNGYSD